MVVEFRATRVIVEWAPRDIRGIQDQQEIPEIRAAREQMGPVDTQDTAAVE